MDRRTLIQLLVAAVLLGGFFLIVQVTSSSDETEEEIKDKSDEQNEQLIDSVEELAIDLELPNYNEDMSLEELESLIEIYSNKIVRLTEMEHQLDSKFYTETRNDMEKERSELFNLLRKKRDEEFEWTVLESNEDLKEHYNSIIPGLKRAKKLGVVEDIKQTFVLEDSDYEFTIDQVWSSSEGFYLLYNIKVGEVPKGRLFHYLHLQQGRNDLRELWRSRESVYYNGRIYGAVKYLMENNKTEDHDTFDIGIQVGQNQLHRFHNKTIPIKEHKDIEAKYKFTVPIKRTVSQNGITVTIDRLEHRLGGNRLYLTADEHRIFGISGEVDNQRFSKFKYQGFNNDNGNEFNLPIKSSDQLPDQMNVELNELHLVTDQSLTFEVDASNIEYQEKVIINKRIGEVFGFSYFINHLEYNGDGLFVYLRKENRNGYHNYEIPMPVSPNSPEFNNITIINSNGEEIKDQYFRTDVRPHENLIGFTIPSDGEKYQIKFSDILIRTKFYDKFNVEIKKQ